MENKMTKSKTLGLPLKYEGRVQLCFDVASELIPASEIYLYGSYAENQVLPDSQVKLLILIGEGYSKREMKTLGWEVEDLVYRISNEAFKLDVLVLSLSLYQLCIKESGYIGELVQHKKNLRQVCWIDK